MFTEQRDSLTKEKKINLWKWISSCPFSVLAARWTCIWALSKWEVWQLEEESVYYKEHIQAVAGSILCSVVLLEIHKTFHSSAKFSWEIFFLLSWMGWGGMVECLCNDLDSFILVFITFWLKCSSPVDRGVGASVLKVGTMSPWQHEVPWAHS